MCLFRKKDEIRFNYKSGHYGVVKKKYSDKYTSVFMSTKTTDDGRRNVPMKKNADPNDNRNSYFMKRVRTYPKSTYGRKQEHMKLTWKDRRTANKIYRKYRKRNKR